ncbi:uncharacterized protein LOC109811525 [Cajanus cajan]|uniref:Pectinesterase inhibitor domain-containing protein n=2 Tax=Cajanus cajan TaxID=3821 RepID=A0A151SAW0_CAJCA|nr:uncharacterized protein LOC109811522 [Cajanus cajan]XP_020230875.1 uncharacterized protein LOC109811525 [Cajanus cajan]KYP51918.1 hypothetical protein KK1_026275 [Cajanus cajan]
MKCVLSSKNSTKADGVGIATIIVDCIKDKANILALNTTNLASTTHGKLKPFYQTCAKDYDYIAKKELILTKKALHKHEYDNAESCMVKALTIHVACRAPVEYYCDEVPSGVIDDMNTYEELCEAASTVITKL